jgi:hypothetical protein
MTQPSHILKIAANQGGIIRLDQALESGLTARMVKRRVACGEWQQESRAVYRIIDMDRPLDRARAAVAALPGAVASHETAAKLHTVPRVNSDAVVVTVHARTTHSFPGVAVRRTLDLAESHITVIDGLPTTTIPRTIIDLAADLHPRHVEAIVDDLVLDRRLCMEELDTLVRSVARRGKPGSTHLRAIVDSRLESGIPSASKLERLGLALLLAADLPRPVTEYSPSWNPTIRFDAAYPGERIAIEWDSKRWHGNDRSFQADRTRDRISLLHGWRVFRFTWSDVAERPDDVSRTIRTALRSPTPPT